MRKLPKTFIFYLILFFPINLNAELLIEKINIDAEFFKSGYYFCPLNKPLRCDTPHEVRDSADNDYDMWDFTNIEYKITHKPTKYVYFVGYLSNQKGSINSRYLTNIRSNSSTNTIFKKLNVSWLDLETIPLNNFLSTSSKNIKTNFENFDSTKNKSNKFVWCKNPNTGQVIKIKSCTGKFTQKSSKKEYLFFTSNREKIKIDNKDDLNYLNFKDRECKSSVDNPSRISEERWIHIEIKKEDSNYYFIDYDYPYNGNCNGYISKSELKNENSYIFVKKWKNQNDLFNFNTINKKKYVTADSLNIRNRIKGQIIGNAIQNSQLAIIKTKNDWSNIITEEGLIGWVSDQYLSNEPIKKANQIIEIEKNDENIFVINRYHVSLFDSVQYGNEIKKIYKDDYLFCSPPKDSINKNCDIYDAYNGKIIKVYTEESELGFVYFKYLNKLSKKEIDNYYASKNNRQNKKIFNKDNKLNLVSNDNDYDPPFIVCDNNLKIKTNLAQISCDISEENTLYAVIVNGERVSGNLEKFKQPVQVPFGLSKVEVEAIDEFGNQSNYIVSINREFSLDENKEVIDGLYPGKIKDKSSNDKVAVIIGIQNYDDIPDTKYSDKDAMAFAEFANQTLNIPSKNIKYMFNEDAKYFGFKGVQTWLENKVDKNTEVYIFYSGHGLGVEGKSKLLPSDFVTQFQEESSYEKDEFLSGIANLNPNHIYAFFDTCFSGLGRDGETLIAGLKNISIVEEVAPVDNITIFNSSSGLEYSTDFDEAGHGLFSYYLMKGLEGNADINSDNEITSKELFSFIKENVSDRALDIGLSQNPSLIGESDNVIVRW